MFLSIEWAKTIDSGCSIVAIDICACVVMIPE